MKLLETDAKTFGEIIPEPYFIYGSAPFSELNRHKAEKVHYLLFREGKYRLGLTGGERENVLYSPFSAPFGGFVFLGDTVKLSYIDQALELLCGWAIENRLEEINITLPPLLYAPNFVAKQINALYRTGFVSRNLDLDYYFRLEKFDENYLHRIWRNARNKIHSSRRHELAFMHCKTTEEKKTAYQLIQQNRKTKGYHLRMSWDDVERTIQIIPSDMFLIKDKEGIRLASVIVFHVSKDIVQLIYWGDIETYSSYHSMNFLAYKLFEHYEDQGKKIIDLGPAGENSIHFYGLGEFKESMGCEIQPKMSFTKRF